MGRGGGGSMKLLLLGGETGRDHSFQSGDDHGLHEFPFGGYRGCFTKLQRSAYMGEVWVGGECCSWSSHRGVKTDAMRSAWLKVKVCCCMVFSFFFFFFCQAHHHCGACIKRTS